MGEAGSKKDFFSLLLQKESGEKDNGYSDILCRTIYLIRHQSFYPVSPRHSLSVYIFIVFTLDRCSKSTPDLISII